MAWSEQDIPDQAGRVAVVTGGNGGLGFATVAALARAGAHVVIAARNLDAAEAARRQIEETVLEGSLEIRELDLASLASVRAASEEILTTHSTIDVLVNNAGVMATPERTTADGFELQFGTNHLGHFLLTARLLPALLRSDDGRVVSVTSSGRFFAAPLGPSGPEFGSRGYDPWRAYGTSKRANLQFAVELDRRLASSGASLRSMVADPGFSSTELQARSVESAGGWSQRFFHRAVRMVGSDPRRGALPQLRAATDPFPRGGMLYSLRWILGGPPRPQRPSDRLVRPGVTGYLWSLSEELLGERFDVSRSEGPET